MKLEGLRRGNRSARAGEVLRATEQPRTQPWDPRDVELFSGWLKTAENFNLTHQLGYAVFALSVIAPHLVTSEIRKAVVAGSITQMKFPLKIWQAGKQVKSFSLGSLAENMTPALLVDPSAQLTAPKQFWDQVHEVMQDSSNWYRNYVRVYALQFPGRLDPQVNEIFEQLRQQFEQHRLVSNSGHDLVADLATIRIVAPQRFTEIQLTGADRQIIQEHLRNERKQVEDADGPWGTYPEELFLAMVALADQVTLSKEHGLQLEFAPPAIDHTPALPERPQFS